MDAGRFRAVVTTASPMQAGYLDEQNVAVNSVRCLT